MKFKKILSIVLVFVLAVSVICFPVTGNAKDNSKSKISSSLKEKMEKANDDDNIPVYIFLKNCNKKAIEKNLKEKYNIDKQVYDNPDKFYSQIVPKIKVNGTTVRDLVKTEKITEERFNLDDKDSPISLAVRKSVNYAINKNVNSYLKKYRTEVANVIGKYVSDFVESNKCYLKDIILKPDCAEFIIANVKKSDIDKLTCCSLVDDISYFENKQQELYSWNATSVTKSDYSTGLGSTLYNNGSGYDGTGVTVGIIEAGSGRYDSNNYNLENANNLSFVNTPGVVESVTSHATNVTSLICGKHVTIGGKKYGGAAIGATVYQTAANTCNEVIAAIIMLKNLGVHVINYSAGYDSGLGYSGFDKAVDDVLCNNQISFVVCAGNHYGTDTTFNVSSPGKAYNAITVGNLATKTGNNANNSPYSVYSDSCTLEGNYIANKPDVVAPGTCLYLPVSSTNDNNQLASGTSYSAPIVTGIAAQIMQCSYVCKVNINALKNYLINGATNDLITGTTVSYGNLTDESGAGLVDALKTFQIVQSTNKNFGVWLPGVVTPTAYSTEEELNLNSGQRIRIVLVFSKSENIPLSSAYGNNIDIRLISNDTNSTYCVSSESTNNNVEIIDTIIPSTGTYYLQMRLSNSILQSGVYDELRYLITWRII